MSLYSCCLDRIPDRSLTQRAIILDLDETLVHTCDNMNQFQTLRIMTDPKLIELRKRSYVLSLDDVVERRGAGVRTQLWGVARPHLEEFLIFCFSYFRVVTVWSAGQTKYVQAIVNHHFRDIQEPHVVYTWPDCETGSGIVEKPLQKMISGVPCLDQYLSLNQALVIDDRSSTFRRNPGNGILIPVYSPKPNIEDLSAEDDSLLRLMSWLKRPEVIAAKDIRTVDKSSIFTTAVPVNMSFNLPVPTSTISDRLFTSGLACN